MKNISFTVTVLFAGIFCLSLGSIEVEAQKAIDKQENLITPGLTPDLVELPKVNDFIDCGETKSYSYTGRGSCKFIFEDWDPDFFTGVHLPVSTGVDPFIVGVPELIPHDYVMSAVKKCADQKFKQIIDRYSTLECPVDCDFRPVEDGQTSNDIAILESDIKLDESWSNSHVGVDFLSDNREVDINVDVATDFTIGCVERASTQDQIDMVVAEIQAIEEILENQGTREFESGELEELRGNLVLLKVLYFELKSALLMEARIAERLDLADQLEQEAAEKPENKKFHVHERTVIR